MIVATVRNVDGKAGNYFSKNLVQKKFGELENVLNQKNGKLISSPSSTITVLLGEHAQLLSLLRERMIRG